MIKSLFLIVILLFSFSNKCFSFDIPYFEEFPGNCWYVWEKKDWTLLNYTTYDSATPNVAMKIEFKEDGSDEDCIFRSVKDYTPIWSKSIGISFWLKGNGSENYGVLGINSCEIEYKKKRSLIGMMNLQ
jgi:hypothetical protein